MACDAAAARLSTQGTRLFGVLSLLLPPTLIPVFWTAHAGACASAWALRPRPLPALRRTPNAHTPSRPSAAGMNANARVNWDVAVSLSNVASGSRRLWVPLAAAYVVTFYTLALLRRQYKEIAALRLRELCSDRASAEAYAVLCLDIPSLAQAERDAEEMACPGGSDEDADADADADDPPPPALTARPGRGGAARARAVLRRFARAAGNALFRAMTAIAFGYTVAPDGGARPATVEAYLSRIYPGVPMRAVMVPPLHAPKRAFKVWKMAEAAAAADAPPQHAGGDGAGPLGEELLGEDRRTAAVHASHRALLRAQAAAAAEPSHAAFVLFGRRADAAAAARTLLHSNPLHWQLRPAPGPGEVYWEALRLRWWERRVRGMLAAATAVLIALFFLAPVTAISSLSTLERVATWVPPLQRALRHPAARGFLEGYLPGLALAAALTAVQAVFVLLARREGALCASDEDRAVASRLFIVLLIDVFLGGTVARVLVSLLLQLSQLDWDFSLQTVLTLLGSNVPATWPLFVTFIAVRAGSGLPLELSRLPVVAAGAIRAAAGRAPRWRPGRLPYGTQVPNILLIFLVVRARAPAPEDTRTGASSSLCLSRVSTQALSLIRRPQPPRRPPARRASSTAPSRPSPCPSPSSSSPWGASSGATRRAAAAPPFLLSSTRAWPSPTHTRTLSRTLTLPHACTTRTTHPQVLFVYERVYETNGAWWPHVARRILLSLIVSHVTLAGVFALKVSHAPPPPPRRLDPLPPAPAAPRREGCAGW